MKRTSMILTGIIGLLFITIWSNASAQNKVVTIEMPESGHLIIFPMSPKEIAASKSAEAKQASKNNPRHHKSNPKLKAVEMADGHVAYFPMTARDVAAEKADKARKAKLIRTQSSYPKKKYVAFELPESGKVILFPTDNSSVADRFENYTAGKSEDNRCN